MSMKTPLRFLARLSRFAPLASTVAMALTLFGQTGCAVSSHPHVASSAGVPSRTKELVDVMDRPGPIAVETVTSVKWQVPREGLLNLDHPKAKAANLQKGDEPIVVDFHVLRHPGKGTFLVDSGFEKALRDDPDHAAIRGIVASYLAPEKMTWQAPLGEWLSARHETVSGVFLTHAHLDHVGGLHDLPRTVPVYTGPGELSESSFLNMFVQSSTDRELEGMQAVGEWRFGADPDGYFDGVVDVFGDKSLFALWVPGHTQGSTAYLARTPKGPVLMVGDASHTVFGWKNGVEPGEFSSDRPRSAGSLERLRKLVAAHPSVDVRLGHQHLDEEHGSH